MTTGLIDISIQTTNCYTLLPEPEISTFADTETEAGPEDVNRPDVKTAVKHLALFVLTFISVSFVGIMWVGQSANADGYIDMLPQGVLFASVFLLFLGTHEFGHYFAAVYHKIKVTLPYFIPFPAGIGTFGAVIRIKEQINDTWKLFDIGIAGPLAGFVISILTLLYGFATLPGPEYIMNFTGHGTVSSYIQLYGAWPDSPPAETEGMLMILGNTLLYDFLASFFDNVPPMWEMYHYPFLFAGWLGLFFTALNLTPVGQLDGGHIVYSLLGFDKHQKVARVVLGVMTTLAGMEAIPFVHQSLSEWYAFPPYVAISAWGAILWFLLSRAYNDEYRWIVPGWICSLVFSTGYIFLAGNGLVQSGSMIWVVWSFFITFFVGLDHPPAYNERPLGYGRRVLGWSSMAIFILCISPNPMYFI